MNFIIFIFIFKIISIILLPSDEIWNQTLQYIDEGLMYNFNKRHFIFDEENFTALDIDDKKMKALYNKQENIFRIYGIASYIFAVSYINESIEAIGSIRNNTRDNLRNDGYYVDNSIFTVFSIDSINGLIYTGNITKFFYITNDNAKYMKEKIINNLENESYYKAWDDFLDDIIYFCNKNYDNIFNYFNNNTSKPNNNAFTYPSGPQRHSNEKTLQILVGIGGAVVVIGFIISIICCCCCCKKCKFANNDDNSNYDFNRSYGGNSGYSGGNNSIGGYSGGNNSCGGYSGGNNSCGGYSGGNNSCGGSLGGSGGA